MSRLSVELLERWDKDPDAGYRIDSAFTIWWTSTVEKSITAGTDQAYKACVESLDDALTYTIHATQSDVRSSASGLQSTMEAMEFWRACDSRLVPTNPETFDLEDLDQAILLVAFQFDSLMGTEKWASYLDGWFSSSFRSIRDRIDLGGREISVIEAVVDDGEDADLEALDSVHWVLAMLEWFKLEDPRRDIGIDLETYRTSVSELERELRAVFPKLKRARAVIPDRTAPKAFWWRQ